MKLVVFIHYTGNATTQKCLMQNFMTVGNLIRNM